MSILNKPGEAAEYDREVQGVAYNALLREGRTRIGDHILRSPISPPPKKNIYLDR